MKINMEMEGMTFDSVEVERPTCPRGPCIKCSMLYADGYCALDGHDKMDSPMWNAHLGGQFISKRKKE